MDFQIKHEPDSCGPGVEIKEELSVEFKQEEELSIDVIPEEWWYSQKIEDEELEYKLKCEYNNQTYFIEEKTDADASGHNFIVKQEEIDDDEFNEFEDVKDGDFNPDDYEDDEDNESEDEDNSATHSKKSKLSRELNTDDESCPNVTVIDNYVRKKYAVIACHLCQRQFSCCYRWTRHMHDRHPDFMAPMKDSFDYWGVCKLCEKQFRYDSHQFLHYLFKHTEQPIKYLMCKICSYKDFHLSSLQQHVSGKHPQLNGSSKDCPLCCKALKNPSRLKFHIMDEHCKEFQEKFIYSCHLCSHSSFDNSQHLFLEHLAKEHNLNNPEMLQFTLYDDMYKCEKCNKLYVNVDMHTLIEHYLTHDIESYWSCKYCQDKYLFQESNMIHMCSKMIRFYQKLSKQQPSGSSHKYDGQPLLHTISVNENSIEEKQGPDAKSINWQTFEQYVKHICPFCNKEFSKFQIWQIHMRERHRINSLEGLQMATVPDEPQKLQCLLCHTFVAKTAINLHTHRFQHLPFKPYKCSLCAKSLGNYHLAMQHITQFQDVCAPTVSTVAKACSKHKTPDNLDLAIEISCSLCNGEKFAKVDDIIKHYQVKHNNFKAYFHKSDNGEATICNICQTQMRRFDRHAGVGHFVQHLDQRPFKCKKCQRSFSFHRRCKLHLTEYHVANENSSCPANTANEKVSCVGAAASTENEEFIGYACPECNESLFTQKLWDDHVAEHHNFFDKNNVALLDSVDGKYKCKECSATLRTSTARQQQHKLSHMPYKSYICLLCYYRFNRLHDLHRHLKLRHFSAGSFVCCICPAQTSSSYERSEHIKHAHSQSEWPENMCLLCFNTFKHLRLHMQTHEMSRSKYDCKICFTDFIYLKDYKAHMTRKHNETVEPECKLQTNLTKSCNGISKKKSVSDSTQGKLKFPV